MKLSIIRLIILSALLYLFLTSIPVYLSYNELINAIHQQTENSSQRQLNQAALQIGNYIKRVQRQTSELANKQEIKDIAAVWDDIEIQNWAIKTRNLLPDTIGLAIVNPNGAIIGQPEKQRIGPQCLIDVKKQFAQTLNEHPPYHRFLHGLRHFDLYANILSDDSEKYLLLHSISLKTVEEILMEYFKQGIYLSISNTQQVLLEIGTSTSNGMNFQAKIPDTTWHLNMIQLSEQELSIIQFARQSIVKAAFVIATIFTLITALLYNLLRHDTNKLQQLLSQIGEKPNNKIPNSSLYLNDFRVLKKGILKQNKHLICAQNQIEKLALEDNLTGLGNRHRFELDKSGHFNRAKRGISISIISLDLDNFKSINDNLGHAAGDQVLLQLGKTLSNHIRKSDSAYRFGGDEFVVVLYSIEMDELNRWFQNIVFTFQDKCPHLSNLPQYNCGISGGASIIKQQDKSISESLERSDNALYQSKKQGKGILTLIN